MKSIQEDFEFTSESVSEGHPDKVCDQISDSILDLFMEKDSNSRVACETLATTNRIVRAGEINLKNKKNEIGASLIDEVVRKKVKEIGYEQDGFHWKNLKIENLLHNQSTDISQGVDKDESNELYGAGDQGIMFGYACDETNSLMPAPIDYSHKILKTLSDYRHNNDSFFGPDSKSQVSVLYKNNRPQNISSIVVSSQHLESANNNEIRKKILEIIEKAIPKITLPSEKKILINPTGRFVIVKAVVLSPPVPAALITEAPVTFAALTEEAEVAVIRSMFSTPLTFRLPVPVTVDKPEIVAVNLSAVVAVLLPPSVTVSAPVSVVPKLMVSLPEPNFTVTADAALVVSTAS